MIVLGLIMIGIISGEALLVSSGLVLYFSDMLAHTLTKVKALLLNCPSIISHLKDIQEIMFGKLILI